MARSRESIESFSELAAFGPRPRLSNRIGF